MRSDKGKAFVMRREGKSYREISRTLGVAKSTLSNWFKGVDFSAAIKEELTIKAKKKAVRHMSSLNKVRGIALKVQYEMAEQEAHKEMKLYRNVPLFAAGVGMLAATGAASGKHAIRFHDSDPKRLQLVLGFLQQFCSIERQAVSLVVTVPCGQDVTKIERYWSRKLGVTRLQESKTLPKAKNSRISERGSCTMLVTNAYVARKVQLWIDHLPEMVLNTVPQRKKRQKRGHG